MKNALLKNETITKPTEEMMRILEGIESNVKSFDTLLKYSNDQSTKERIYKISVLIFECKAHLDNVMKMDNITNECWLNSTSLIKNEFAITKQTVSDFSDDSEIYSNYELIQLNIKLIEMCEIEKLEITDDVYEESEHHRSARIKVLTRRILEDNQKY